MNISSQFILKPIATSLLMFAILLSGILSYQLLPISSLPEIEYPVIQIATFYPGASPKVMATSVTAPLERQLGQIPGLSQMDSISSTGSSLITLQFNLDLSLDVAEQEVQAAINYAYSYLPSELPNPPVYNKINPANVPILTLGLTSKNLPMSVVEDYAETHLAQKISQISGVGAVSMSGGQRPAVRIQINTLALSSYGLSIDDVRTVVEAANANASKGSFDGKNIAYNIDANDQLVNSSQYQDLIISYNNNNPIRLSDVAVVNDAVEDTQQIAWVNNEPAILLNIQRQSGANVIKVADSIKSTLPKFSASLPGDIKLSVLSDRTVTIRNSIKEANFELALSTLLVIIVIFLFLHNAYATAIPAIAVPLSLIGSFSAIYMMGFSLNNLTLMSLIIATGFVVDDAIVMIENISRYVEQGVAPLQAALKGSGQIGFTIISLTISLIAALIPLFFMEDVVGRLFREFAITLTITILISAFISLTLTPMLCAKLLHSEVGDIPAKKSKKSEGTAVFESIKGAYLSSLSMVLRHQTITLGVTIMTLCLTLYLFYVVPKGFFPAQDSGLIQGISVAPEDISFDAMVGKQQDLVKFVLSEPDIESVSSFIGIDGTNTTLSSGRMLIILKPLEERKRSAQQIIQQLQGKLTDTLNIPLYLQAVKDLSIDSQVSRTEYQYSITAHEVNELNHWTDKLLGKMQKLPILQYVTTDQQNNGSEVYIEVDRDKASTLGISMQGVVDVMYDAFGQRQISNIFTEWGQYRVILETIPGLKQGEDALRNTYVKAKNGELVPLISFATITKRSTPAAIMRQNQYPSVTVSFNLGENASLGAAVNHIDQAVQELKVPHHIHAGFQGTAQAFANSLNNAGWLVIAAIIVVYIVLGVLYESYIHPITILSTLPSACIGALLALMCTGRELNVISLIGIVLLIGIVKKNAIIMIDFALEQQRAYRQNPMSAISEACALRFRPILMTTVTAMMGAVPLVLGSGMGAEIRQPLGITIIGGLALSQLITLYTTPVIYLAFDRFAKRLGFSGPDESKS